MWRQKKIQKERERHTDKDNESKTDLQVRVRNRQTDKDPSGYRKSNKRVNIMLYIQRNKRERLMEDKYKL